MDNLLTIDDLQARLEAAHAREMLFLREQNEILREALAAAIAHLPARYV